MMKNTYTILTITNEYYLYKLRLEKTPALLSGDGRYWWRAGTVTPTTEFINTVDIIPIIKRIIRFDRLPIDLELILKQLLSCQHLRRIPLGAEYRYTIIYANGAIMVKRKNLTEVKD